ncbi:Voltage-gated hydrogen channel 1 [Mactra antiquata]
MLLAVVILCILDCALVLGELALDLYKVKATLEHSETVVGTTETFLSEMSEKFTFLNNKHATEVFSLILNATVIWTLSLNETRAENRSSVSYMSCVPADMTSNMTSWISSSASTNINSTSSVLQHDSETTHYDVDIVGKIAQVFHYSSLTILALVLIQTILKAVCAGKSFFRRKIEVFDAFVVFMSFLMDFSFLLFLHDIDTKDFLFILAILLPWRVIRVVDSLIVAVKDHEHFRLKLVYKRKKKIQGNLRDAEVMLQKYISQATELQRLCISEGIEEWKIDKYLKNEDSVPPTPQKRKFKFKLDETLFQGHNRTPRCSMPALDFHGVKLPSGSKSKMSFSTVSNSIKHHISKTLHSKRSPLASTDSFGSLTSNGEIQRRKKRASEDLCTMHEEELINEDSIVSSRATSESGDVFSHVSTSGSLGSDRICTGAATLSRNNSESADDESTKIAKLKEDAKRRLSESTINKGNKSINLSDLVDTITFASPSGKIITKPHRPYGSSVNSTNVPSLVPNISESASISEQTANTKSEPASEVKPVKCNVEQIDNDTKVKNKETAKIHSNERLNVQGGKSTEIKTDVTSDQKSDKGPDSSADLVKNDSKDITKNNNEEKVKNDVDKRVTKASETKRDTDGEKTHTSDLVYIETEIANGSVHKAEHV